jgi:2-polyprenyl-3-methyl-5-hydroxy-6-metoxy-1,4-benzoquinol methylase
MSEPHVCPWWLAYTFDNPLRRLAHDPAAMLGPYIHPGGWAADLGCGLGFFSLGLARLVGPKGMVYGLDLQEEMLARMMGRAKRAHLADRVMARKVKPEDLCSDDLHDRLDLALAFWMMHEVPDQRNFLSQIWCMLKPGAAFFITEPKFHVNQRDFEKTLVLAAELGLELTDRPQVAFSRAAVFTKVLTYDI